jgi:hypothetical protein
MSMAFAAVRISTRAAKMFAKNSMSTFRNAKAHYTSKHKLKTRRHIFINITSLSVARLSKKKIPTICRAKKVITYSANVCSVALKTDLIQKIVN